MIMLEYPKSAGTKAQITKRVQRINKVGGVEMKKVVAWMDYNH